MTPVQLETRIQEAVDGVITEENWRTLQDEMAQSEDVRRLYCQYIQLNGLLDQRSKGLQALSYRGPVIPIDELISTRRKKAFGVALGMAALFLVMAAVVMNLIFVKSEPSIVFNVSPGSKFQISHAEGERAASGQILEKGSKLTIYQGVVELHFKTGVRAVVSGPGELRVDEDNQIMMSQGKAWFDVPVQAQGFRVDTDELSVVDLGTQFGVYADTSGGDEVHLFKGTVEVSAKQDPAGAVQINDGGLRVDEDGELERMDVNETLFLTELPDTLPYLHWSFDSDGIDQYLASGSSPEAEALLTRGVSAGDGSGIRRVEGKYGKAIAADGSGAYVESNWKGVAGDAPRTIAYWIRLPENRVYLHPIVGWGQRNIGNEANGGSFFSFIESMNGGVVCGVEVGGFWMKGMTNLQDGQWHHIAHVYTGRTKPEGTPDLVTFVDGIDEAMSRYMTDGREFDSAPVKVNTITDSPYSASLQLFTHLWAGRKSETYDIKPEIDELFIFEAALLPAEIKKLYYFNDYQGSPK